MKAVPFAAIAHSCSCAIGTHMTLSARGLMPAYSAKADSMRMFSARCDPKEPLARLLKPIAKLLR
jgi:hypothetical protein